MRMRRARAREEVQLAAALRESERLAVAHRAAPLTAAEEAASLEVAVRASLQLDDAAAPNSSAVHAAYASQLIAEMEPSSRWLRAEGLRRRNRVRRQGAVRTRQATKQCQAVRRRARARRGGGGRAPSGGRAHSGGARSRLRERRGACTIIAQYGASHEGGCGRALITARCAKAAVEERQLVAAIEASLASHASWRGTADSDGRYTREVTRLACMQAEAATWACTGAPASHVAISRYGAQHGARGSRGGAGAGSALGARAIGRAIAYCTSHSRDLCRLIADEGEH